MQNTAMENNGESVTIDQLARMVQKGFEETATKQDLKNEIEGLRSEMNKRFDRIENILLEVSFLFSASMDHRMCL